MKERVADHPQGQAALEKTLRAMALPRKAAFRSAFIRDFREVDVVTPNGLWQKKAQGYRVSESRLAAVVERIIKALFFLATGDVLGAGSRIKVAMLDKIAGLDVEAREFLLTRIIQPLQAQPRQAAAGGAFVYRFQVFPEGASAWGLVFYDEVFFLALVTTAAPSGAATTAA